MRQGYFEYFCSNTSLHGFKFLSANDDPVVKKSIKRIFWTTCIAVSYYYLTTTMASTINKFSLKSTSVNLDASYRDWNNTFPAVSICMTKGSTMKLANYMKAIWKESSNPPPKAEHTRLFRSIQALLFLNYDQPLDGINVPTCTKYNETCGIDFDAIKKALFPHDCHQIMKTVKFLGREIDCDEHFKLHRTEIGECFIANSLYSSKKVLNSFDHLSLRYSNEEAYERSLEIEYFYDDLIFLKIFIHSPEELPFYLIPNYRMKKAPAYMYIALNVVETINQEDVEKEPILSRDCRFPNEYLIDGQIGYGLSTCKYAHRMQNEVRECNCTLPIGPVPRNTSLCSVSEFECVVKKARSKVLKADVSEQCQIPTCVGMDIINIGQFESEDDVSEDHKAVIKVDVLDKPNLRYIRRVSTTRLDMTVQVGGIVGLFIGASILTLVEIIFLVYDICKRRLAMNRRRKIAQINERRFKK